MPDSCKKWTDYLWDPVCGSLLPLTVEVLVYYPDKNLEEKNKISVALQIKANKDKMDALDAAKKTLSVLFVELPLASVESTTCLADKVGWIKMATTFAISYGTGNWALWIDLVKPYTCECGMAPYVNIIPNKGATAGLHQAIAGAINAGCAIFGQSLAGAACKDPAMAQLVFDASKGNPAVLKMSCAEIMDQLSGIGSKELTFTAQEYSEWLIKKNAKDAAAAQSSSATLLLLVGGAYLLSKGRK